MRAYIEKVDLDYELDYERNKLARVKIQITIPKISTRTLAFVMGCFRRNIAVDIRILELLARKKG